MRGRFDPHWHHHGVASHQHQHHERDRGEFGFRGGPPGRGHRRGGRTRRGDIRIALLGALSDGPGHGYQLIQRLEERTGGRWRPSPGSVYPTLQLLEDSGFVTASQQDDKKVYALTEAGQAELGRLIEQSGPPPWATGDGDGMGMGGHGDLRRSMLQLVMAVKQVGLGANPTLIESAAGILDEARRKLYALLAEA